MVADHGLIQSIQARLLNHAKRTRQDYNRVLERYGLERLLYQLYQSPYADRFVLKGALLMLVWFGETLRPTRDADRLGFGDLGADSLADIFRGLCRVPVNADGMEYFPDSVSVAEIRENNTYGEQRVRLNGCLGSARLALQVDIGIGDAVTPEPEFLEYPSLLDLPSPKLRAYRPETTIAEKPHILVVFGMANSRMKDIFDISVLIDRGDFDGKRVADAIKATFERRDTSMPEEVPVALTEEFYENTEKQKQWEAFHRRSGVDAGEGLASVMKRIRGFAWPVMESLANHGEYTGRWNSAKGWSC